VRIVLVALLLSACVSPRATLTKGDDVVVCAASGFGIISGTMANNRYQACVSEAQMRGFKIKDSQ
jgi:hypothetical protein